MSHHATKFSKKIAVSMSSLFFLVIGVDKSGDIVDAVRMAPGSSISALQSEHSEPITLTSENVDFFERTMHTLHEFNNIENGEKSTIAMSGTCSNATTSTLNQEQCIICFADYYFKNPHNSPENDGCNCETTGGVKETKETRLRRVLQKFMKLRKNSIIQTAEATEKESITETTPIVYYGDEKRQTEISLKELPCKHKFHTECIDQWFTQTRGQRCPICRAEASQDNTNSNTMQNTSDSSHRTTRRERIADTVYARLNTLSARVSMMPMVRRHRVRHAMRSGRGR